MCWCDFIRCTGRPRAGFGGNMVGVCDTLVDVHIADVCTHPTNVQVLCGKCCPPGDRDRCWPREEQGWVEFRTPYASWRDCPDAHNCPRDSLGVRMCEDPALRTVWLRYVGGADLGAYGVGEGEGGGICPNSCHVRKNAEAQAP